MLGSVATHGHSASIYRNHYFYTEVHNNPQYPHRINYLKDVSILNAPSNITVKKFKAYVSISYLNTNNLSTDITM